MWPCPATPGTSIQDYGRVLVSNTSMGHQHPRKHFKYCSGVTNVNMYTHSQIHNSAWTGPTLTLITQSDWTLRPSSIATKTKSIQTCQQWPYNRVIGLAELCPHSIQSQMFRDDGNVPFSMKSTRRRPVAQALAALTSGVKLWSKHRQPLYPGGSPLPPASSESSPLSIHIFH